jgi:CRISPR-associated protein Cas2
MITLVIYDISDDKDRSKLAELLMNYGLERIQYSGFKGILNTHDRLILVKEVKRFVTGDKDSVYVIRLCKECANSCQIVSKKDVTLIDKSQVRIV